VILHRYTKIGKQINLWQSILELYRFLITQIFKFLILRNFL